MYSGTFKSKVEALVKLEYLEQFTGAKFSVPGGPGRNGSKRFVCATTHGSPAKAVASFGAQAALGPIDAPVPPSTSSQLPQWKRATAGLGLGPGAQSPKVFGDASNAVLSPVPGGFNLEVLSAHTPECLATHGLDDPVNRSAKEVVRGHLVSLLPSQLGNSNN